jgi:hypothetical protein
MRTPSVSLREIVERIDYANIVYLVEHFASSQLVLVDSSYRVINMTFWDRYVQLCRVLHLMAKTFNPEMRYLSTDNPKKLTELINAPNKEAWVEENLSFGNLKHKAS